MRILVLLSIIAGLIVTAGCQADTLDVAPPSSNSTPLPIASDQEISTPDRSDPNVTKMPERVPPTEPISPITGEVPPELLETIINDLSERTGAAPDRVVVIQDQEVAWNDGSLGCPRPGEFYTQALVNGYWVILEVDGARYDYRVAATGYFFLCERGMPPGPPSTPNS